MKPMSEIEDWIQEAAANLGRSFTRCAPGVAEKVVREVREVFVDGNPRVWWLSLKRPFKSVSSVDISILDVLPTKGDKVWFIPETDQNLLPVYDLRPEEVELIRRNCPLFEYYVTDKLYRWIVIETDHDKFIICNRDDDEGKSAFGGVVSPP